MVVVVHSAAIQDRDGARLVLGELMSRGLSRLTKIWVDGGYRGKLINWAKAWTGWVLEVVLRPADQVGFKILPRRWVVERTFGWLGRYRRLSKDYEELPQSSEAMVYLGMIRLMLRRLEKNKPVASS